MVWCGVAWCGVAWRGVVWRGVVWCGAVRCGVVRCGAVWCGVLWCGVVSGWLWGCGGVLACSEVIRRGVESGGGRVICARGGLSALTDLGWHMRLNTPDIRRRLLPRCVSKQCVWFPHTIGLAYSSEYAKHAIAIAPSACIQTVRLVPSQHWVGPFLLTMPTRR